jgi:RNA polymerase-binding transcription factor DksA
MSDDADFSVLREIHDTEQAVSAHVNRSKESPLIEKGIKLCLDCSDPIPEKRAILTWTVRCIDCQELLELEERNG